MVSEDREEGGGQGARAGLVSVTEQSQLKLLTISRFCRDWREREEMTGRNVSECGGRRGEERKTSRYQGRAPHPVTEEFS